LVKKNFVMKCCAGCNKEYLKADTVVEFVKFGVLIVEILGRTSLTSLHAITQSVVGRDPFNTFLRICVLIQL